VRGLILALQLLTRLPTPQLKSFEPAWLAESARWFAMVGLLLGGLLYGTALLAGRYDPWTGALAGVLLWVALTGALHLDGLADLADALGAAHRSRERFLEVLKDPHVGSFGVVVLVLALAAKLVLLMLLLKHRHLMALLLIPAWARLCTVGWALTLPPLAPGSGAAFAQRSDWPALLLNLAALAALSTWLAPALLAAPLAGLAWWAYLKRRLGGMTGDCLGAGVELCEIVLLALALVGTASAI
jgi:adenosylcobinamide-GDP ribazoletransferase